MQILFIIPQRACLLGGKASDGKLHDYYFTFVNGVAISYDLIEPALGQ